MRSTNPYYISEHALDTSGVNLVIKLDLTLSPDIVKKLLCVCLTEYTEPLRGQLLDCWANNPYSAAQAVMYRIQRNGVNCDTTSAISVEHADKLEFLYPWVLKAIKENQ